MVPVANDWNVGVPAKYIPAIAMITVKPGDPAPRAPRSPPGLRASAASSLRPAYALFTLAAQVEHRIVHADGKADQQDHLV